MDKQQKGRLGENAVCAELVKRGHTIITTNYHKRVGEIDIISRIGKFIVFTEVKARRANSIVSGLEAVDAKKQRKIILCADAYLTEFPTDLQPRYDIAEVTISGGEVPVITRIDVFEDAFTADGVYTIN